MLDTKFTHFPILTTERLTLRQLAIADEQVIFAIRSDREINKYLDRPPSTSIDDARNFIKKVNENVDKNAALYWGITLRDKNILAGTICIFGFSEEDHKCEIGYELLPTFQGKRIMKEALQTVIAYAFNTIRVQKVEAFVHKDNQRSIKLLEKVSFSKSTAAENAETELVCFCLTSSADNSK